TEIWPGPLKVVLSQADKWLYGLKSQVVPVRLIPAHIELLGRVIVSRIELVPSTLTTGSSNAVLVAPIELTVAQPTIVSMESNCVLVSVVACAYSPVPRF